MFHRRIFWWFVIILCIVAAGWLAMQISNSKLNAQERKLPTSPTNAPSSDAVAALQSRVEQLEKELQIIKRNGFFVGLSRPRDDSAKPDPNEIAILRKLVASRTETWQRVNALRAHGGRGGEASSETQARFQLYLAFAQLASAEHQPKELLEYLRRATKAAEHQLEAVTAAYETGTIMIEALMNAQQDLAQANLLYYWAGGKMPPVKVDNPWAPTGELPRPEAKEEP
jgi:hypothetical protein